MELLYAFSGLSLACACVLSILPSGSLKRTAAMALGLMMTLFWFSGLTKFLRLPAPTDAPSSVLESVAYDPLLAFSAASEAYRRIAESIAARAADCDSAEVTMSSAGDVLAVRLPSSASVSSRAAVARALGIDEANVFAADVR